MKTRKKSYFGLSAGKFFIILLVVFASVYFILQFMFVKNSQKSEAKDFKSHCCGKGADCDSDYYCMKISDGWAGGALGRSCAVGVCQPKKDRPRN
ncbi:MAG: hypothetical protein WCT22_05420 [Patescibacteria group bacterium]